MKTTLLLFLIVFSFTISSNSQNFKIFDDNGDIGITSVDNLGYVVIEKQGSAKELYDKIKLYVNSLMANPEFSIVGDMDGELLKWTTVANFRERYIYKLEYITTVLFKDGKIRVQYNIREIKHLYTLSGDWYVMKYSADEFYYTKIYKANTNLKMTKFGELKDILETHFNKEFQSLNSSLEITEMHDW